MHLRATFSVLGITTCALIFAACGHEAKLKESAGVPVSGVPVSGVPVSGVPASGVPASGVPAAEAPVPAAPVPSSRANTEPPEDHSESAQPPAPQVLNSVDSENRAFRANITFEKGPFVSKESIAIIEFFDFTSTDSVTVTDVTVVPWMSEHAHGAPTRNMKVLGLNAFTYRITGLGFVMSGLWELQVSAMVNGKKDRIILTVKVP